MTGLEEHSLSPRTELLTRVSSLYYLEDMTQAEIGTHLGLSRLKVNRLLREARDSGIVEITVHLHRGLALPLEADLVKRFGLERAIVVGADSRGAERMHVGRAGADFLTGSIRENTTIAVGMGRNVRALAEHAPTSTVRGLSPLFVSGIGGSSAVGDGLNSNEIVSRLATAFGGRSEGLFAPAYTAGPGMRDAFLEHADVRQTVDHARQADIALVGVGDAAPDSLVVQLGCLTREDMARLRMAGAVGDILGGFFDVDGTPGAEWVDERVVGLTRADLAQIPNVVAIVSEPPKAEALLGALRSGLINTLITSVDTAQAVLATGH